MNKSKFALFCLGLGFITLSCEVDTPLEEMTATSGKSQQINGVPALDESLAKLIATKKIKNVPLIGENIRESLINQAVAPSECGPTNFIGVQNKYIAPVVADPIAMNFLGTYFDLSFLGAYFDTTPQYFGVKGEYTPLVAKRQRDLETFWNMPNEIRINGQHNATLNNRERVADIYELFGNSREEALEIADIILYINTLSPNLPESPFFSADGYAASNKLIVIGDGLVQMLTESGIDADIVWTGVLSHEWAHQIQFANMMTWYPNRADQNTAEATRLTELEADFFASYYMTHKRGATYNWKRVEQYFNLFFQIGDCSFEEDYHHGTPAQRLAAARLGYELAQEAQKKGHILSAQEVHHIFLQRITSVI